VKRHGSSNGAAGHGLAAMDTEQLRLTFPAHVTIRLRSGGVLEADGHELGACGAPLPEQQQVVDAKFEATREAAAVPAAWRRRRPVSGAA
jgi:hypothetical protein